MADHRGEAVGAQRLEVAREVIESLAERVDVGLARLRDGDAAVHLEGAVRGDEHHHARPEARHAALDVEELLGPEVEAEARLGDHVFAVRERHARREDGVAPVGDVAEGPAVHDGGRALARLHEVGHQGVEEQRRHRRRGAEVARGHGLARRGRSHHDAREARFEVFGARGEAEDGHDLARRGDVEGALARGAVALAHAHDDVAQGAVVHVHGAAPAYVARVEVDGVAEEEGVVDDGREQVVGARNGVNVAGEVQVDVGRGHEGGLAAAGASALHAEDGAERGLTARRDGPATALREAHREGHGGGGLPLARGRGIDRRHEHQAPLRSALTARERVERDLGLVSSPRNDVAGVEARVAGHVENGSQRFGGRHGGRGGYTTRETMSQRGICGPFVARSAPLAVSRRGSLAQTSTTIAPLTPTGFGATPRGSQVSEAAPSPSRVSEARSQALVDGGARRRA